MSKAKILKDTSKKHPKQREKPKKKTKATNRSREKKDPVVKKKI